ncbi:MAG: S-methyl-5-thioribose-1-phosphate isomerase [Marinilabiliales bacterium]|mgnify:CR=1 FL=1|nr:MAG: S-methyl-5-thioribose-1-phosphate isomerase [Marinilabiliales bacterium]
MIVNQKHYTTIWLNENERSVSIIDQRKLPFEFSIESFTCCNQIRLAIKEMWVRGAPLIGVAAAYGVYLASIHAPENDLIPSIRNAAQKLLHARPTAINLKFAIHGSMEKICRENSKERVIQAALDYAENLRNQEIENCRMIGIHGLDLIKTQYKKTGKPVQILTHCNAGWLACVDYGTATAPIYMAHDEGIPVHVWVDETRPRNQGARLTAWELSQHGIPNTLIADNTGGHLMQHQMVDMVIVGTDRTTITGDVANKIGTYLKALAAKDNNIPFYVAAPSTSIDWSLTDGVKQIPIEKRDEKEVLLMEGINGNTVETIQISHSECKAVNYGFDVTPARLVTSLITERGICKANEEGISCLFPEKKSC